MIVSRINLPVVNAFDIDGRNFLQVLMGKSAEQLDVPVKGDLTLRDIFVTANTFLFGDFENGLGGIQRQPHGGAHISKERPFAGTSSLKCFSADGERSFVKYPSGFVSSPGSGQRLYIAAKVFVERYSSGEGAGFQYNGQRGFAVINRETEGFETVSRIYNPAANFGFFVGSFGDCDAFIDELVCIDLAVFGDDVPDKETLDSLYESYVATVRSCSRYLVPLHPEELEDKPSYDECREAFIRAMNLRAKRLGMTRSRFVSPSGNAWGNRSTSRDLLKLLIEASSYDEIIKIWNKKRFHVAVGGPLARKIRDVETTVSHEGFEAEYFIFGGKTGHFKNFMNLALIAGKDPDTMLAGVVMNREGTLENRFVAMKELFDVAMKILEDPSYVPAEEETVHFEGGIVCKLPNCHPGLLQRYPLAPIFEKNADMRFSAASVSKLLTLVTALDYVHDLNEKIVIEDQDIQGGSGSDFFPGDVLSVKDVFFEMLLPSSNTCARALARHVGAKILKASK